MLEDNPDISLFVEAGPAFYCPSIITRAMGDEIERVTGVPAVCIAYDGRHGSAQERRHHTLPRPPEVNLRGARASFNRKPAPRA
jgi:hypothetical protein